jgi:hypothetical protein
VLDICISVYVHVRLIIIECRYVGMHVCMPAPDMLCALSSSSVGMYACMCVCKVRSVGHVIAES